MRKSIILFFMLIFSISLFSQNRFSYQAALRNSNGTVMANQSIIVNFTIHQGTGNEPLVYSENQNLKTQFIWHYKCCNWRWGRYNRQFG